MLAKHERVRDIRLDIILTDVCTASNALLQRRPELGALVRGLCERRLEYFQAWLEPWCKVPLAKACWQAGTKHQLGRREDTALRERTLLARRSGPRD